MPREKSNLASTTSLKRPSDELVVNDQIMVKNIVLGGEPCLAQIIEIKHATPTTIQIYNDDDDHQLQPSTSEV